MSTVAQFTTHPQWDATVRLVAERAAQALPDEGGRVCKAVALVLQDAVTSQGDGTALVASQSEDGRTYQVNGHCECADAQHRAPEGWCKHRLAWAIYRRAVAALPQVDAPEAPAAAASPATPAAPRTCPEAAFSLTLKGTLGGHEVLLTARGQSWEEFAANVGRLKGLLDPATPPQPPALTPPAEASGWCAIHDVAMRAHQDKQGQTWYSHKDANGQWCKGRKRGRA